MNKKYNKQSNVRCSNRDGQSLIEILISLAVGTILIIAAVSVMAPALRTNSQADKVQVSSALGKEFLENIRSFGEGDWHNISNLATSSANKYFLVSAQSPFVVATGTEGISADGVASGTVGYWKFDESTGAIAYDFSGVGSNGTLTNNPAHISGNIGGALSFNGSSSYAVKETADFRSSDQQGTITMWVKPSDTGTYRVLFGSADYASANRYLELFLRPSGALTIAQWNADGGSDTHIYGDTDLSINQWHSVAVTSDGSQYALYVDGAVQSLSVQTGTNNGDWFADTSGRDNWSIGALKYNNTIVNYFNGAIDDVRVYSRALSATEIRNIYQAAIYTRYFYLDVVGRDAGGVLLSGGGTNDPSTEKVTVVYGWPGGPTSSFSMYLTRFRNNVFNQTDWSGGSGQEGPATTTNSGFSTSTNIYNSTTTGSIIIQF